MENKIDNTASSSYPLRFGVLLNDSFFLQYETRIQEEYREEFIKSRKHF